MRTLLVLAQHPALLEAIGTSLNPEQYRVIHRATLEEAEPLLISGYEGMREREGNIRERTKVLTESIQNFIQLFEATSRPEKAAEWRDKLALVLSAGPRHKPPWPRFLANDPVPANL